MTLLPNSASPSDDSGDSDWVAPAKGSSAHGGARGTRRAHAATGDFRDGRGGCDAEQPHPGEARRASVDVLADSSHVHAGSAVVVGKCCMPTRSVAGKGAASGISAKGSGRGEAQKAGKASMTVLKARAPPPIGDPPPAHAVAPAPAAPDALAPSPADAPAPAPRGTGSFPEYSPPASPTGSITWHTGETPLHAGYGGAGSAGEDTPPDEWDGARIGGASPPPEY